MLERSQNYKQLISEYLLPQVNRELLKCIWTRRLNIL
jgi:hypothetical protein